MSLEIDCVDLERERELGFYRTELGRGGRFENVWGILGGAWDR